MLTMLSLQGVFAPPPVPPTRGPKAAPWTPPVKVQWILLFSILVPEYFKPLSTLVMFYHSGHFT